MVHEEDFGDYDPKMKQLRRTSRGTEESLRRVAGAATARDRDLFSEELLGSSFAVILVPNLISNTWASTQCIQILSDILHQDALVSPARSACSVTFTWFVWGGGRQDENRHCPYVRARPASQGVKLGHLGDRCLSDGAPVSFSLPRPLSSRDVWHARNAKTIHIIM